MAIEGDVDRKIVLSQWHLSYYPILLVLAKNIQKMTSGDRPIVKKGKKQTCINHEHYRLPRTFACKHQTTSPKQSLEKTMKKKRYINRHISLHWSGAQATPQITKINNIEHAWMKQKHVWPLTNVKRKPKPQKVKAKCSTTVNVHKMKARVTDKDAYISENISTMTIIG